MGLGKQLLKGSGVNMLEHVVKIGVVFYNAPLMLRYLREDGYGAWLLAMNVIGWFLLLDVGVSIASTRYLAMAIGSKSKEDEGAIVAIARKIFIQIGWAILFLSLLAVLLVPWIAGRDTAFMHVAGPILICGASTAARFFVRMPMVLLRANVRYDLLAWCAIVRTLLQVIVMTLVLASGYGVLGAALVHASGDCLEIFLQKVAASKMERARSVPSDALALKIKRDVFSYGRSILLVHLGESMRLQVNPFLITRMSGVGDVPLYSLGMRLITMVEDVVNAVFGGQVLAAFSQLHGAEDQKKLQRQFARVLQITVCFSVWAIGGMVFFGQAFFLRWLGEGFVSAHSVMLILAFPYLLRFMQYPSHSLLYTLNRQRWLVWSNFIGGIVTVVIALILGPLYGLYGIVAGTALEMTVFYLLIMPWLISQCTGIHPVKYIFVMVLLRAGVSLLLPAVFAWWALTWLEPDYGLLFLAAAGYSLVFALVAPWVALDADARKTLANLLAAKVGRRRSSAA